MLYKNTYISKGAFQTRDGGCFCGRGWRMYTMDEGGVKISKGPYLQSHALSELRKLMNATQHARHP